MVKAQQLVTVACRVVKAAYRSRVDRSLFVPQRLSRTPVLRCQQDAVGSAGRTTHPFRRVAAVHRAGVIQVMGCHQAVGPSIESLQDDLLQRILGDLTPGKPDFALGRLPQVCRQDIYTPAGHARARMDASAPVLAGQLFSAEYTCRETCRCTFCYLQEVARTAGGPLEPDVGWMAGDSLWRTRETPR